MGKKYAVRRRRCEPLQLMWSHKWRLWGRICCSKVPRLPVHGRAPPGPGGSWASPAGRGMMRRPRPMRCSPNLRSAQDRPASARHVPPPRRRDARTCFCVPTRAPVPRRWPGRRACMCTQTWSIGSYPPRLFLFSFAPPGGINTRNIRLQSYNLLPQIIPSMARDSYNSMEITFQTWW
jgi:hypothetical protein